jgi:outer membrane murein-binding lipoprotein Lpp
MNTQSSMHPRRTLLQLTLLGSLLLAGCASVPDLGPSASSKTMQDMASQQTLTRQRRLDEHQLVAKLSGRPAQRHHAGSAGQSPDLAAAQARLAKAAGQAEQTGASNLPSLD